MITVTRSGPHSPYVTIDTGTQARPRGRREQQVRGGYMVVHTDDLPALVAELAQMDLDVTNERRVREGKVPL